MLLGKLGLEQMKIDLKKLTNAIIRICISTHRDVCIKVTGIFVFIGQGAFFSRQCKRPVDTFCFPTIPLLLLLANPFSFLFF